MRLIGKILLILLLVVLVLAATVFLWYKLDTDSFVDFSLRFMPGNADKYAPEVQEQNHSTPLNGKTIIFLGSSVTQGAGSRGVSFVDYFEAIYGVNAIKEAVGGTTLVSMDERSYIPRMKSLDTSIPVDVFVCQLSTNDATKSVPLGTVSESMNREEYDTTTVAGAIEYIISYASEIWDCPIVFYTNPRYDSPAYDEMVQLLYRLQDKWNIGIIDFWSSEEANNITPEQRKLWMVDSIHPTMAGYLEWWMPSMEAYLESIVT